MGVSGFRSCPNVGKGRLQLTLIFELVGHLHDGGDNIVLNLNSQTVCDSKAHYGTRPDYVASGSVAPANMTQWATIADMDICSILKPVKKGDVLSVIANCELLRLSLSNTLSGLLENFEIWLIIGEDDMTKHPARKGMHGEDEGLMGVVMAQMAVPMKPK
jgi:hypothetical protein